VTPFAYTLLRHRGSSESYNKFAERIGYNPSYLFRLRNGSRRPSMTFIERVTTTLGLNESEKKELIKAAYLSEEPE
jgi:transcriptional regulator with XRE-family HTH domain